jgi:hypothetical protein
VAQKAIPDELPRAITRNPCLIEAVLAELTADLGVHGRAAQAGRWALTGSVDSPITITPAAGCPPSREEVLAEAAADPVGSTAPPGVPTDFCDQVGEARHLLGWLIGETDEIPIDDDNRGRFIGARDDYARTGEEIRQIRDRAFRGLQECDLRDPMDPDQARHPWRWSPSWMNAAWLHGVRDLLTWVLGEGRVSPLSERAVSLPTVYDLSYEEISANEVIMQGRPGGIPVDPNAYPPPQYGEGIQAAIRWLRGQSTTPPVDNAGCSPYGT